MTCIHDILDHARATSPDAAIQSVTVGLHWTAVQGRYLGLSATQAGESCCYAEDISGAGRLHHQTAHQLADLLLSPVPLEASVGMAALNAFLEIDDDLTADLNARDLMVERSRGKTAAMIGHFHFADAIRQAASALHVLELQPREGDLPADLAPEVLPRADVISITATTLLNGTFDALAPLFKPGALVVMMGPTTPLSPVLFDYGIDVLAGSRVTDPQAITTLVAQASPLHRPGGLRRVTVTRPGLAR